MSWLDQVDQWCPLIRVTESWGARCPNSGGVYRLVGISTEAGERAPVSIDRVCGRDPNGTLYIGEGASLTGRLPDRGGVAANDAGDARLWNCASFASSLADNRDLAPVCCPLVPNVDPDSAQHWRQSGQLVREGLGGGDLDRRPQDVEQLARGSHPLFLPHERPHGSGEHVMLQADVDRGLTIGRVGRLESVEPAGYSPGCEVWRGACQAVAGCRWPADRATHRKCRVAPARTPQAGLARSCGLLMVRRQR
jgi:hypothetical protein